MIGKKIAHYQVIEKIGAGGMGVVYKARDTHLDRSVAIKVLPAEAVADVDRKRRLREEGVLEESFCERRPRYSLGESDDKLSGCDRPARAGHVGIRNVSSGKGRLPGRGG